MLAFRSYTNPNLVGRINRKRFFYFSLLSIVLFLVFTAFVVFISHYFPIIAFLLSLFIWPYVILLFSSVIVRRLHDQNNSGWWGFLAFIYPFIIMIQRWTHSIHTLFDNEYFSDLISGYILLLLLYCLLFKGTDGLNAYGPDPLDYEDYDDYLEVLKNFQIRKNNAKSEDFISPFYKKVFILICFVITALLFLSLASIFFI